MRVAVIFYSATGTNYRLAQAAARAAEAAGAEVRLRKVAELAPPEAIEQNPAWKRHVEATRDVPEARPDDLVWADVIVFSTPTRFGNVPSQLKQFLDTTGPLWAKGALVDKVVTAMTSAQNPHGGQEATLLSLYTTAYHWGAIVVPPGYTDPAVFAAGGNPYGTSATVPEPDTPLPEAVVRAAEHQVRRAIDIARRLNAGR
ncbi:NAD(P)H:quinone oxidoreductase [Hydrogenibacillus schlegelii]|uniref:NAD(P)H:quinone oxidoreductase, type IV n=1 Tax=Hydrogenibacillus schlegelii TaxID=1484 RepID=A0A179INZ7_HYDSH|nr:NAD(P)H:quinone oxidoreductase [Hydrogenibacillus schlegelii]OAR03440.1 NAD(P)H:quinone oxidoreductase, type IV [Hydrogenibacillus schlegelii]